MYENKYLPIFSIIKICYWIENSVRLCEHNGTELDTSFNDVHSEFTFAYQAKLKHLSIY